MMAKTDWNAADYFNLEDYDRIIRNLNSFYFLRLPHVYFPQMSVGAFMPITTYYMIVDTYNAIAVKVNSANFPQLEKRNTWFNWQELNLLEGLYAAVMESQAEQRKYGTGNYYGRGTLGGGYFG
jgi:hypothetical protein